MADLFTISPEIIATYQNGIDSLIRQLGKDCTLYFPPLRVPCPNCTYDPILKKSTNIYNGTGPVTFVGICPYCNGIGLSSQAQTKVIKALIQWTPKDMGKIGDNVDPKDIVKIKTFAISVQDILNSTEIVVDSDQVGIVNFRCKILRGPILLGLQTSRYCAFFLQKIH